MRVRSDYGYIRAMTDADCVSLPTTDDENSVTLFVKITPALDADLQEASRKAGVSKSGMVRMALPLGITSLLDRINPTQSEDQ